MGAFGSSLVNVANKAAGDLVEGFGKFAVEEGGAYGFTRSTKALLDKTPVGKIFSDFLDHTYSPAVRQEGSRILQNKLASGVAPHIAAKDALKEATSQTRQRLLGRNDEALIKVVHTATRQHGVIYGNAVADSMSVFFNDEMSYWRNKAVQLSPTGPKINLHDVDIRPKAPYTNPTEMESSLRRALSWMYTPMIAIPHLGQFANVILDNGIVNTAKGMSEYFGSATSQNFKRDLIDSGALFDEMRFDLMETAKGGGLARKLFNHPGFSFVRQHQIGIAAASGKSAALDAASKLQRGPDKWAEHTLAKLGLDTNAVRQRGWQLTADDIKKAMYTEADRTIFLRDPLKTPWKWEESFVSRMTSQYRHFAFRQTQFLSAAFKDAYKHGGLTELVKTATAFGTMFPAFGELIHSIENIAEFKSPTDRDDKKKFLGNEYADDMAHAAGFGMFYSMMRAGMWDHGKTFFVGPLFSTAADLFIGIPFDISKGKYKTAARRVTGKLGPFGKPLDNLMK